MVIAARHPDRRTLLVALAVLALVFFVVPTRVHERYLFPFYALAAILAAVSVRWRVGYIALSIATFANMYVVLTTIYDNSRFRISDWLGIGGSINDELWVAIIAMVHLLGLVWAFVQLRADGRERLADEFAEAGVIDDAEREVFLPIPEPARERRSARPRRLRSRIGPRRSPATRSCGSPRRSGARARSWARAPWACGSASDSARGRTDRSAALAREGGGRFDKLDLWLLVVLVVATLVLRTFRLAEPLNMHFDEVYHARTATEFLQDWRYGDESNIYEWTHPHLGKYLIAAGITAFGDDRVSATGSIDAPVNDALESRHTDIATGDQTGARLWLATDAGIRGYDLGSRAEVARYDRADRALAHDPTAPAVCRNRDRRAVHA